MEAVKTLNYPPVVSFKLRGQLQGLEARGASGRSGLEVRIWGSGS